MEIRIGVRPSPLAIRQADEALRFLKVMYPKTTFVLQTILTRGDKDKVTPLSEVKEADFFTREIDEALLAGRIDMAVHSSKDLAEILPQGLKVLFETKSISRFDVLVSKSSHKLTELVLGSRIGISSQRRRNDLKVLRDDLEIVDVRGNIEERLALIDTGKIDALILAHAALIRLGLEEKIAEIFPLDIFRTHPKQGSLSLVVRGEA